MPEYSVTIPLDVQVTGSPDGCFEIDVVRPDPKDFNSVAARQAAQLLYEAADAAVDTPRGWEVARLLLLEGTPTPMDIEDQKAEAAEDNAHSRAARSQG